MIEGSHEMMEIIVAIEQHLAGIASSLKAGNFLAGILIAGILTFCVLFKPDRSSENRATLKETPRSGQSTFKMSS